MCSQRAFAIRELVGLLPRIRSSALSDIHTSGSKPHVMPRKVAGTTPAILTG